MGPTKDSDLDWGMTKVGERITSDLVSNGTCSLVSLEYIIFYDSGAWTSSHIYVWMYYIFE